MVSAARTLLCALLLSLGSPAAAVAGRQGQTTTTAGAQGVSLRLGGPARSRSSSTAGSARTRPPRRTRVTVEDDSDVLATADRLAGPAAAELLATVTGISPPTAASISKDHEGSLEEGMVIYARENVSETTPSRMGGASRSTEGKFAANTQEPEIRLTTSLPPATSRTTGEEGDVLSSETLSQWSTAGSKPSGWPRSSPMTMPAPEDLRLVLMPWGPWHCHCKSGTMSRSRAGKLHGLSGRLRVGALSQLRIEHRPCTYQQCSCNRLQEECPLDTSPCPDAGCRSRVTTTTTTTTTTTSPMPPIHLRRRPSPHPPSTFSPSPSAALAFWKRVRIGLENIWNSLSRVFTEMQPTDVNQR
ncbi:PREDICTED: protein MENT [Chinchilla lanigera]|uniref:protein MENT n=1 Tax=Chinchilla lanigera TaxID=34839 RepID=UPI00038EB9C3|nr:PREDICTED: protein MENT [Chinchilla lanigera]